MLFLSECHVDTALMRTLLYGRQKPITHIKGALKAGDALHQQAERYGDSRLVNSRVVEGAAQQFATRLRAAGSFYSGAVGEAGW